jgi:hypothetical protein
VPFTTDDARAYIATVRWQFAKTMPQWPHEYTVREWRQDLEHEFVEFVALIRREGIVKPWPRDAAVPRYNQCLDTAKELCCLSGLYDVPDA